MCTCGNTNCRSTSLPTGGVGQDGVSSFAYVASADDNIGTGFTYPANVNQCFLAIRTSATALTPVVGDFAGLWFNKCGERRIEGLTTGGSLSVAGGTAAGYLLTFSDSYASSQTDFASLIWSGKTYFNKVGTQGITSITVVASAAATGAADVRIERATGAATGVVIAESVGGSITGTTPTIYTIPITDATQITDAAAVWRIRMVTTDITKACKLFSYCIYID